MAPWRAVRLRSGIHAAGLVQHQHDGLPDQGPSADATGKPWAILAGPVRGQVVLTNEPSGREEREAGCSSWGLNSDFIIFIFSRLFINLRNCDIERVGRGESVNASDCISL